MIGIRQHALERPGSLAESTCVGAGDIQDYQIISRRREVPINESIVPGVGLSSCKHCGRECAAVNEGIHSVLMYSERFIGGDSLLCPPCKDLDYLTQTDYDKFESESESVSRMLNALVSVLRKRGKGSAR